MAQPTATSSWRSAPTTCRTSTAQYGSRNPSGAGVRSCCRPTPRSRRRTPTACSARCCASTPSPTGPTRSRRATCSRRARRRRGPRSTRWATATRSTCKVDDAHRRACSRATSAPDAREDDPERGPMGYDEFNLITGPGQLRLAVLHRPEPAVQRRRRAHRHRHAASRSTATTSSTAASPGIKELGAGQRCRGSGTRTASARTSPRCPRRGPAAPTAAASRSPARSTAPSRAAGCRCSSTTRGSSPTGRATGSSSVILDDKGERAAHPALRARPRRAGADGHGHRRRRLAVRASSGAAQTIPVGNPLAAKVVRYQYVPECGTCDPTIVREAGAAVPASASTGNVIAGPLGADDRLPDDDR